MNTIHVRAILLVFFKKSKSTLANAFWIRAGVEKHSPGQRFQFTNLTQGFAKLEDLGRKPSTVLRKVLEWTDQFLNMMQ